jgi:outer membrane receptor for ferrienterochelin and colicin
MLHSEVNIPLDLVVNQNLTLGTEWNQQRMKDRVKYPDLYGRRYRRL